MMVYVHRCSAVRKESSDRRGKFHQEGGWSITVEYNRSQVRSRIFCFLLSNNSDCEGHVAKGLSSYKTRGSYGTL